MPSVLANIAAATNQFIRQCDWSKHRACWQSSAGGGSFSGI